MFFHSISEINYNYLISTNTFKNVIWRDYKFHKQIHAKYTVYITQSQLINYRPTYVLKATSACIRYVSNPNIHTS